MVSVKKKKTTRIYIPAIYALVAIFSDSILTLISVTMAVHEEEFLLSVKVIRF